MRGGGTASRALRPLAVWALGMLRLTQGKSTSRTYPSPCGLPSILSCIVDLTHLAGRSGPETSPSFDTRALFYFGATRKLAVPASTTRHCRSKKGYNEEYTRIWSSAADGLPPHMQTGCQVERRTLLGGMQKLGAATVGDFESLAQRFLDKTPSKGKG